MCILFVASTEMCGKRLGRHWWTGLAIDLTTACGLYAGPCDLQPPIRVATSSARSMRSF